MPEADEGGLRSRISPERLGELLRIAAEVFAERGFDGASVNEMAKRANASKGTFYSRYPSKEALLMAVMGQQVHDFESALAEFMLAQDRVEDALTFFADRTLSVVLSDQMMANYRVVTLEARRFPELGKAYYENGAGKIARYLAHYFSIQIEKEKLKVEHPLIAAELFIDSIVGMPRLRVAMGISKLEPEEKAQRIEVAVQGFMAAYGI